MQLKLNLAFRTANFKVIQDILDGTQLSELKWTTSVIKCMYRRLDKLEHRKQDCVLVNKHCRRQKCG